MMRKSIGIDIGTNNVLIYIKGKGIVLNEPSVVAVDVDTKEVLAVGQEARSMIGRTPGKVQAIRPLKDGVIADFEISEIMLNYFLKKAHAKGAIFSPRMLICCPSNITLVERNAIREVAERLGAKNVYIEQKAKAAALGAGLDISKPIGNMVIDIGGGTTDIAILSISSIVRSTSLKIAGNTFDDDIIKYIRNKHRLLIGEKTAEDIKITIGTVCNEKNTSMEIKGRNLITGLPDSMIVSSKEIKEALKDSIDKIVSEVALLLEIVSPELAGDITKNGITLTGGGSLVEGLDKLLSEKLKMTVIRADNPLTCVAEGVGILLDSYI